MNEPASARPAPGIYPDAQREQLAATREILRAISRMPAQSEALCELILQNAMRLAGCQIGAVGLYEGGRQFRCVAVSGVDETFMQRWLHHRYQVPKEIFKERGPWRPLQLTAAQIDAVMALADPIHAAFYARMTRGRALFIPLATGEQLLGTFTIIRNEDRLFIDEEIELIHTFADHAVVALENARVLADLEKQNALHAANAEILRAIGRTPDQLEAICGLILQRSMGLAGTRLGHVLLYEGNRNFRTLAMAGSPPEEEAYWLGRSYHGAASVFKEAGPWKPLHIPDIDSTLPLFQDDPALISIYQRSGVRAVLYIPLVTGDRVVGAFGVAKSKPGPFSAEQIEILQSFADHAVVAIDNAGRLKALARRDALQSANADILHTISESRGDAAPIFDIILRKTCEFTGTDISGLGLHEGDGVMRFVDGRPEVWLGAIHERSYRFPLKWLQKDGQWSSHHLPDLLAVFDAARADGMQEHLMREGIRSILTVPLVSEGRILGVFHACSRAVRNFSEEQIALLQTFASQAVIALENARILADLERQNSLHAANAEILRAISQSRSDPALIFGVILRATARFTGAEVVGMGLYEDDSRLRFVAGIPEYFSEKWRDVRYLYSEQFFRVNGEWGTHVLPDLQTTVAHAQGDKDIQRLAQMGIRSMLTVPLVVGDRLVGLFHACHKHIRPFSVDQIATVRAFSDYAVIALENTRLFRALQGKNEELEQASRHKSEFLANMSHELRTPLNAIIGFSEVLKDELFGPLNEKQTEYARDIHGAGHHLLTLINDVLDLAKVEAGRMELLVEPFDLPAAIDSALILVRERANRQGIALESHVDPTLGCFVGDERKFKQVLLNLLSNAVKFSPGGGSVHVIASAEGDKVSVSVRDQGIGIPAAQQQSIFDAFHQAESTLAVKREGTGLGLTLARRFVELHGGAISVMSESGKGSTFTFSMMAQPWPTN